MLSSPSCGSGGAASHRNLPSTTCCWKGATAVQMSDKVGFAVLAEEWEDMWAGFSWSQLNPLAWTVQDALHPKNIKCAAHSLEGGPFSGSVVQIADDTVCTLVAAMCRPACLQRGSPSTRHGAAGLGWGAARCARCARVCVPPCACGRVTSYFHSAAARAWQVHTEFSVAPASDERATLTHRVFVLLWQIRGPGGPVCGLVADHLHDLPAQQGPQPSAASARASAGGEGDAKG